MFFSLLAITIYDLKVKLGDDLKNMGNIGIQRVDCECKARCQFILNFFLLLLIHITFSQRPKYCQSGDPCKCFKVDFCMFLILGLICTFEIKFFVNHEWRESYWENTRGFSHLKKLFRIVRNNEKEKINIQEHEYKCFMLYFHRWNSKRWIGLPSIFFFRKNKTEDLKIV